MPGPAAKRGLAIAREIGHRRLEGNTLCNLGFLHFLQGRLDEAESHRGGPCLARELGHVRLECIVLCNLGIVLEASARPEDARAHFEAALAIARSIGDPRSEGQFLGYLGVLQRPRGSARRGATLPGHRRGAAARGVGQVMGLGVLLCQSRRGAIPGRRSAGAAASLATAMSLALEVGAGPSSEIGCRARARAKARRAAVSPRRPGQSLLMNGSYGSHATPSDCLVTRTTYLMFLRRSV